jgi:hypothetical protein
VGSQVRDTNRVALVASLRETGGCTVVDLGIVKDSKELLRETLLHAASICTINLIFQLFCLYIIFFFAYKDENFAQSQIIFV